MSPPALYLLAPIAGGERMSEPRKRVKADVEIGPNKYEIKDINNVIPQVWDFLVATKCLYRKPSESNEIYLFNGPDTPRRVQKPDFNGILHRFINFRSTGTTNGQNQTPGIFEVIIEKKYSEILFFAEERSKLPPFEAVVREPAVVFLNGTPTITPRGYDRHTQIYFLDSDFAYAVQPSNSIEHLSRCFSGVPFASPGFKANVIASLLGAIVMDPGFESPLVAVTGNQPGIGKTKLTATMGYILTGCEPNPVTSDVADMNKEIGARFLDQQRFILLDNITTPNGQPFRSDPLAVHITSGWSKSVSELKMNRSITQKGVLFTLTANHCQLHEDLAVRALMVRLYREELGQMIPYCYDYAHDHRAELYAELLGLALSQPTPYAKAYKEHFRFRRWLEFVAPRIEPLFGKLAIDEAAALDSRLISLSEWATLTPPYKDGQEFTAAEIVSLTDTSSTLTDILFSVHGNSKRGKSKSFSTLLTNFANKKVTLDDGSTVVLRVTHPGGSGTTKKFKFEIVLAQETAAPLVTSNSPSMSEER